jgi:hypothetical protein
MLVAHTTVWPKNYTIPNLLNNDKLDKKLMFRLYLTKIGNVKIKFTIEAIHG